MICRLSQKTASTVLAEQAVLVVLVKPFRS
jgi:hypothetical protein